MRDRLSQLIYNKLSETCRECSSFECTEELTDYLLANGVIVPPCKVGDTVYRLSTKANRIKYIQGTTISRIAIDNDGMWLFCECNPIARCIFGKTVFLTKEEAEETLKGGAEE